VVAQCSLCGSFATVRPHPKLRAVCAVCSGPRLSPRMPAGAPEVAEPLRRARAAHRSRRSWRVLAWVCFVAGLLLALPLLPAAYFIQWTWLQVTLVGMLVTPLAVALASRSKAKRREREVAAALDDAWLAGAKALLGRATDELGERDVLGAQLLAPEDRKRIAARLASDDDVSVRVSDAGELLYQSSESKWRALESRVRVEPEPETAAGEVEVVEAGTGAAGTSRARRGR
jgi:hypothetical protein